MIQVGVIGYGYWGPAVTRNFAGAPGCEVAAICDRDEGTLGRAKRAHPDARLTTDPCEVLTSPNIDAVAVVTPVWTHFELAKAALNNGKHIFVEKPFTTTAAQAEELIELAEKRNLRIMVDHTFLFTGAVRKIRQLIDDGTVGKLYYYDSMRVNLGLFQHDVNVIWDLAPHDLSIMSHLITEEPDVVIATGAVHFNGLEDVAYITIYFRGKVIAHINVNWLSPVKVRTTLIGGEKKMLVWMTSMPTRRSKCTTRACKCRMVPVLPSPGSSYRTGDMWAPKVEQTEALAVETKYFIDCIAKSETPFNDGVAGLRVVRILEAANRSLKAQGKPVSL